MRGPKRAVRPQIHSQSEFSARHWGCGQGHPAHCGSHILLTTAANLTADGHRGRLAFTPFWSFVGQCAPLEARDAGGGSAMVAVARVVDQSASLPGASAQIIDTEHLFRM